MISILKFNKDHKVLKTHHLLPNVKLFNKQRNLLKRPLPLIKNLKKS